jgi:hypothetical protein
MSRIASAFFVSTAGGLAGAVATESDGDGKNLGGLGGVEWSGSSGIDGGVLASGDDGKLGGVAGVLATGSEGSDRGGVGGVDRGSIGLLATGDGISSSSEAGGVECGSAPIGWVGADATGSGKSESGGVGGVARRGFSGPSSLSGVVTRLAVVAAGGPIGFDATGGVFGLA